MTWNFKREGLTRRVLLGTGARIALLGSVCTAIGSTIIAACGGDDGSTPPRDGGPYDAGGGYDGGGYDGGGYAAG